MGYRIIEQHDGCPTGRELSSVIPDMPTARAVLRLLRRRGVALDAMMLVDVATGRAVSFVL